jgi:hypothetical protein
MRGEGSVQKSIGEVGTRQTPRRRSFEERKRKKGKEGMMMMMIQMEKQQCQRNLWSTGGTVINVCTQRQPVLPFFNALREEKDFSWGGLIRRLTSSAHKEKEPILLSSSFQVFQSTGTTAVVCVCVWLLFCLCHTSYCASKFLSIRREFSFLSWAMDNPRSQERWRI